MKLFTFEPGTTITEALHRCGVAAEGRTDASAWSWDGPGVPVLSWHHDSPGVLKEAHGSIEGGNYEFPLYAYDEPKVLPIQQARRDALRERIAKAAHAKSNAIILRMNWKRVGPGKTGLFVKKQSMYPHDAWYVGVEWADLRYSRTADGERVIVAAVVRFRDHFLQKGLGEDMTQCSDWPE